MVPCLRDYVAMSLRGKEPTEAISYLSDKKEIAALPAGARNDEEKLRGAFPASPLNDTTNKSACRVIWSHSFPALYD